MRHPPDGRGRTRRSGPDTNITIDRCPDQETGSAQILATGCALVAVDVIQPRLQHASALIGAVRRVLDGDGVDLSDEKVARAFAGLADRLALELHYAEVVAA